jgi:DNA-binding response OmpR family regulator
MTGNTPYLADRADRQFPLTEPVVTLGRSPDCQVFIPDPRSSRRHAEIRRVGESCTLVDLNSANGVFLNERRLTLPESLQDGDEITIASAVFTFHDPEATIRAIEFPLLVVDKASGEIWVNRNLIGLSAKEQALFDLLYRNADRACNKQEIIAAVWPEYRADVFDYQIERLVKRLREKLEPDPRHPVLIVTVRGRGYRLAMSR